VTTYFAKDPTELGLSVSAIVWRDGEILLMRRADNGLWGLPGGFVEIGESVAAAACREVAEETGWSVELGRLIGVYSDPTHQVVDYLPPEHPSASPAKSTPASDPESPATRAAGAPPASAPRSGRGRVQIVNLCFHARALEPGVATTPDETLEIGFFATERLPEPFVPIHRIRIEDGLADRPEASIR
jgi:ADP-ribose pyrophosphatase YjhB (NUDIX family)